jgi:ubiquinol-cytochrome c reductase cytochrome b/c1 subunit
MRDVNYGWLLRYLHANGASMFFIAVYIHIFRGLYYGSYKAPREVLWILGVIIFLLMMATGFMGYVLPWGQMSFWGATVITNLFSAIPIVGETIVTWLWGGYSVDNPTLNRFFSLHYLLPFMIAGVVVLHIWALHVRAQNNPTGVVRQVDNKDTVPFTPYARSRIFAMVVFLIVFMPGSSSTCRTSGPCRQLHPGQPAGDAGAHRSGMVLPAVLRDPARHPDKLGGVIAMFGASWCCSWCPGSTPRRSVRPTARSTQFFWIFVIVCDRSRLARFASGGRWIRDRFADLLTVYYFAHFLVILPLLGLFEKPKPLPATRSPSRCLARARPTSPPVRPPHRRPSKPREDHGSIMMKTLSDENRAVWSGTVPQRRFGDAGGRPGQRR